MIFSVILSFSVFLFATPSVKYLFPELLRYFVDALPVFLAAFLMMFAKKNRFRICSVKFLLVLYFVVYYLYAFLSTIDGTVDSFSGFYILKYCNTFVFCLLISIMIKAENIVQLESLYLVWGMFLGMLHLSGSIHYSDEFHYLNLGHPIGIALTIILFRVLVMRQFLFSNLLALAVLISALSSMYGRSPLLLPFISISIFSFACLLANWKSIFSAKFISLLLLFVLVLSSNVPLSLVFFFLPSHIYDRLDRLTTNWEGEGRYELFETTLELIKRNPLGYGSESSWGLVGYSPHNVYLEVLLNWGVQGFVFFSLGCLVYAIMLLGAIKQGAYAPLSIIFIYVQLRGLIGISTSGMNEFFSPMILGIMSLHFKRRIVFVESIRLGSAKKQ